MTKVGLLDSYRLVIGAGQAAPTRLQKGAGDKAIFDVQGLAAFREGALGLTKSIDRR
jgi:hypothetical protein